MANQYQGSLAAACQDKFQQPLERILTQFYQQGMNLQEVAHQFGARAESVARWARKYDLHFKRASAKDRRHQLLSLGPMQDFLCHPWSGVDRCKESQ